MASLPRQAFLPRQLICTVMLPRSAGFVKTFDPFGDISLSKSWSFLQRNADGEY
jgi:hypothetical protein